MEKKKQSKTHDQQHLKAVKDILSNPFFNAVGKAAEEAANARRPPNNPTMPLGYIEVATTALIAVRTTLERFSAHLRSLDRKRLNGVGIKKQGFIERAYELAVENPEFLPHYLTLDKFEEDGEFFLGFRGMLDIIDQLREITWNLTMETADIWYTDALEFYSPVKEAAKRRVDPAEALFKAMEPFFKGHGRRGADKPETKKQLKRDINALESGKRDGKIVIENISPKLTGGVHKVVDETFRDTAKFRESENGEISE